MKKIIIIPASGIGSRMNADIPKQYLTLANGMTVLDTTISVFVQLDWVDHIIVAVSVHDQWFKYSQWAKHPKVLQCWGGQTRAHSVYNALVELKSIASAADRIFVHDAARPCVDIADIEQLDHQLDTQEIAVGLLAAPAFETVKEANSHHQVVKTLARSQIWLAQTPQVAPYEMLKLAYAKCFEESFEVTDEASALEYNGLLPLLVEGKRSNVKITVEDDLAFANYYLDSTSI